VGTFPNADHLGGTSVDERDAGMREVDPPARWLKSYWDDEEIQAVPKDVLRRRAGAWVCPGRLTGCQRGRDGQVAARQRVV
jgi:hypothetical protein